MSADPKTDSVHDDHGEPHDIHALHGPIMRELADPRDGFEPINPVWMLLVGGILFFSGWYLGKYGGDFFSDVYDETRPPGAAAGPPPPIDPAVLGQRLYTRCTQCHQVGGTGLPGKYPPLAGSEWVKGSPAVLSRILLYGVQGQITVAGGQYGQEQMPAFHTQMKDEQIAAVLTYIRKEWGNAAEPVTAEQVAAARKATATRTGPWTEAELKGVKGEDAVK